METIIGVLIGLIVAYYLGYKHGESNTSKKIFKALGVRDGYRITGVSFEKINR